MCWDKVRLKKTPCTFYYALINAFRSKRYFYM